jgi:hypothetical protein
MRYLMTITLYFFLQNATFATQIKDFTARYELYHNNFYVGTSTRKLTTKNNLLTFSSVAKTAGVAAWFFDITINETSKWQFKNKQLTFLSYDYNENDKGKNEGYQLRLEQPKELYNSHTKKHYPVAENLQDTLGFSVAIMLDLQADKREIKYTIAKKDSLKTYTLKFIKKENIATNNGVIETLKMEHYDPQTKYRFTLWCAENMRFLPIRILNITPKGDKKLLNLTHFNQKAFFLALEDEESD